MNNVPDTAPCAEPPVRHGKCRLHLTIGATCYALRPIPGQPRGVRVISLRSLTGERAGAIYNVAVVDRTAGCTCPDHEVNGAVCKHITALRALGFLPISARTAAESKAEADRLTVARRRRAAAPPAAPVAPSADKPDPLAHARRRHSPAAVTPLASPSSPFVAGWHTAVAQHVAHLQGGAS